MADKDLAAFTLGGVKHIHEGVEAAGIDFHRDDIGVGESLAELASLGALAGAVVDDCFIVAIRDRVDHGTARRVLHSEGGVGIKEAGEVGA